MKIKYIIAPLVMAFMFFTSTNVGFTVPLQEDEGFTESQQRTASKSIGFSPVSQELHLTPGEPYTDKVTVWHQAEGDMEYTITIRGFKQIEGYPGTAVLLSEEEEMASTTSAASWFRIETTEVVVPPNHNFELNYLIEVPEDAASGEYYAQIFFHSEQERLPAQDTTMAYSNIAGGPTFLIRTGDELDEDISLLEFQTTHKFYENPDITFNTSLQNTGNVHVKPTGIIVLTNMFGQELATIEFNPTRKALIRDSVATYISEWESNYLLTDEGKLAIGPITAELTLYYKSESPGYHPITAETDFWIFQWKLALAILGAIVLLVWTTKAIKKPKKVKVEDVKQEEAKVHIVEDTPMKEDNEMPTEEKKDSF